MLEQNLTSPKSSTRSIKKKQTLSSSHKSSRPGSKQQIDMFNVGMDTISQRESTRGCLSPRVNISIYNPVSEKSCRKSSKKSKVIVQRDLELEAKLEMQKRMHEYGIDKLRQTTHQPLRSPVPKLRLRSRQSSSVERLFRGQPVLYEKQTPKKVCLKLQRDSTTTTSVRVETPVESPRIDIFLPNPFTKRITKNREYITEYTFKEVSLMNVQNLTKMRIIEKPRIPGFLAILKKYFGEFFQEMLLSQLPKYDDHYLSMEKMSLDQVKRWISETQYQGMAEPTPRNAPNYPTHLPAKLFLKLSMLSKDIRNFIDSIFDLKLLLKCHQKVQFVKMLLKTPKIIDEHPTLITRRKNQQIDKGFQRIFENQAGGTVLESFSGKQNGLYEKILKYANVSYVKLFDL